MKFKFTVSGLIVLSLGVFYSCDYKGGETTNNISSSQEKDEGIIGVWQSPMDIVTFKYIFNKNRTIQSSFSSDLKFVQRKGVYSIDRDTIKISYDSLTEEEKNAYRIEVELPSQDTLFIMKKNVIRTVDNLYLYKKQMN